MGAGGQRSSARVRRAALAIGGRAYGKIFTALTYVWISALVAPISQSLLHSTIEPSRFATAIAEHLRRSGSAPTGSPDLEHPIGHARGATACRQREIGHRRVAIGGAVWETQEMKRIVCLFVVLAACGGKDAATTTTPVSTGSEVPESGILTPELAAFHDVLSPIWHAEGQARMTDACAALAELASKGAAVKAAAAPAKVEPTKWAQAGVDLEASVGGLQAACGGADEGAFNVAITAVHDAYHQAMSLIVGEHEQGDAVGPHQGDGEHMREGHEPGAGGGGGD